MKLPAHELLLQIVNETDQGMLALDSQLNIVLCNDWMNDHSRNLLTDTINRPLLQVFPELAQSRVYEAIVNTLETGQPAVISNVLNRTPFNLYSKSTTNQSPLSCGDVYEEDRIQQAIRIIPLSVYNHADY